MQNVMEKYTNIFEHAKFGDKYLCRNGKIAVYDKDCGQFGGTPEFYLKNSVHCLMVEGWKGTDGRIEYRNDGMCRYGFDENNPYNIIGRCDEWYDVNDEMPYCDDETWEPYLVRTSAKTKSQMDGAMYVAVYHDYNFDVIDRNWVNEKITHWMKLPQQPNILSNENE